MPTILKTEQVTASDFSYLWFVNSYETIMPETWYIDLDKKVESHHQNDIKKLTELSLYLCIALVFNLCISQYAYAEKDSVNIENLRVTHNKVSLNAKNIRLKEVLLALCDKANIQLVLKGQFPNKVNIAVSNQPTEHFFRKLLSSNDYILVYSKDKQSIKKVLVYESFDNSQSLITFINKPVPKEILDELEWIHYLSTRPEEEAISGLSEIIAAKGKHLESKLYAIEQLSSLSHNKTIVNAMAGGLVDDRPEIREQVVNALGQLEYPTAQQILGQVIFGEQDASLRLQAVKQLANTHTPVSEAFIKAATEDKNTAVQAEAEFIVENLF